MKTTSTRPAAGRFASLAVGLCLLAVALASRWTHLGAFSWPDEQTWLERSAAFVTALERGDLAGTYLADHPGVVPMWGFGSALYLRAQVTGDRTWLDALAAEEPAGDYPALLATAASFTVIATSLAVLAAFFLLIPLLGRRGAALGGLLLALDPFSLTHSRIVHVDALLTSAMLLSTLSFLVYLRRPDRRRYLFLSGLMAGLALLTKTPALFLIPLVVLLLGFQWLLRRLGRESWGRLGQVAGAFGLWLAAAWGAFLLLWPATWSDPIFFLWRLYRASRWGVVVSHGSNFFLGRVVEDPGPFFYPVVLPFRLSPLVALLLPAALVLGVVAWRRREDVRLPFAGLSFVFFFTVMVSLAAKKGDRYLLPVFPLADVVTAWAVMTLLDRFMVGRASMARRRMVGYGLAVGLVLLVALLWLPLAPYYGAYFDPLVGGGPVAERTFAFGQGEGLDLAAEYLNDLPDGQDLLAVTFYPPQFRYYFQGDATSLRRGDWDGTWQFADYVVFYVSQVQRALPAADLVDFFLAQQPEYVARIGGVEFARVYRSPLLLSGELPWAKRVLGSRVLEGGLALTGYAESEVFPSPGETWYVTLTWQALEQLGRDYHFEILLVDDAGQVAWQQAGPPFEEQFPTWWWRPGRNLPLRYAISLPPGLPPGDYQLLARAYDAESGETLPPAMGEAAGWPGYLHVIDVQIYTSP
ncbi:MAG: glycosyltransferase family 39 protein [Anaerolineae bacterium]